MAPTVSDDMKAVVYEGYKISLKDYPVPSLGDNDILVKTVSVALNPVDWKHTDPTIDLIGKPGSVLGCDFSGFIVKVGKNVSTPAIGDHVAGFVNGATFEDEGAFAEYVKTPSDLVWIVPENTLTHDEAATLGCAFWTAVQALYHPTRLGLVEPPEKVSGDEWILVYGGSSAVGLCAINLAHLSGYKVVATASPRNFDLVRSFGADEVLDYKDPEVVLKIKQATANSITKAVDAISEESTQRITAESLGPVGGKIVLVLDPIPEATGRTDIEFHYTLIFTALGRAFSFREHLPRFLVSMEDRTHMAEFLKKLPQLVQGGAIKPLPIKLWEGGLDAVQDGLQYMREGKVSAEKIVYRV